MNKTIWLIVYLNKQIYGSLMVYKRDINTIKKNYLKQLSSIGTVTFKVTNKEPFYGW